jgi:hypothetical protein
MKAQPPAAGLEMLDLPNQVLHIGGGGFGFDTRQAGMMQLGMDGLEVNHQISPSERPRFGSAHCI